MNPRKFLKQFEQSEQKERLVHFVEGAMVDYCVEEQTPSNELPDTTIRDLAEDVVERGLGESQRYEARRADDDRMEYVSEDVVEALKEAQDSDKDYEYKWTEELGEASDGSEADE